MRFSGMLALLMAATGCRSDFGLSDVLADDTDEDGRPDGGGDSPWGHLDPGQLPEVYFAVAWSPVDVEPCTDDGLCQDDVRYAVIDLRGQVIAELDLPYAWNETRHLAIEPAGPGQFTVAAEVWSADPTDDELWSGTWWETWRGDAVAGEITRTAHWDWDGAVLDAAGVALDLGTAARVHVGTWPGEPERALWMLAGSRCGVGALEGVRSVHLSDPEAPIDGWGPEDLLPDEAAGGLPFAFEAGENRDGEPSTLIAVEGGDCGLVNRYDAVAWSPADGVLWTAELGADLHPREVRYGADEGGAVLSLFAAESPGWRLDRRDGTTWGDVPPDIRDAHAGPVLEASSATFLLRGRSDATARDALVILHEGRVVWTIDALKFGLRKEAVFLRDVVLLPPV